MQNVAAADFRGESGWNQHLNGSCSAVQEVSFLLSLQVDVERKGQQVKQHFDSSRSLRSQRQEVSVQQHEVRMNPVYAESVCTWTAHFIHFIKHKHGLCSYILRLQAVNWSVHHTDEDRYDNSIINVLMTQSEKKLLKLFLSKQNFYQME